MRRLALACLVVSAGCGGEGSPRAVVDASAVDAPAETAPELPKGFSAGPSLPRAWQEHAVVTTTRGVFVLGGFAPTAVARDVPLLDRATQSWTSAPSIPAARHHAMAAAHGDDVYVLGGMEDLAFTPVADVWVLRAGAATWATAPPLPDARGAGGAAVLGNAVYVVGGMGGGAPRTEVFAFEIVNQTWKTVAPLHTAREHLAVVAHQGKLWALAGRQGGTSSNLSTVEIYDPATDEWTDGPTLPRATGGCAAVVHSGKLYFYGGESSTEASDELDVFDGTWSVVGRSARPRHGLGLGVLGDAIVLAGGGDKPGFAAIADVELFVP